MEDDQIPSAPRQRIALVTRFFDKLHRYKTLLLAKSWILLVTIALGIGVQYFLSRHAPPVFLSVGRMIVSIKLSIPDAQSYTEELDNFYGTQIALMKSDSVKVQVLNRLQTIQATNASMHASPVTISATISPKTSIFNLQATGKNPDYTQAYLEATMEEYISLKRELLENAANATKSGMQNEIAQIGQELAQSQQDLLNYQASNSVVFLQQNGGNNAAEYLASLTRQLTEDESELNLLKTLTLDENLERQQSAFKGSVPDGGPSGAGSQGGSGFPLSPSDGKADGAANQANVRSVPGNSASPNNGSSSMGQFEQQYLLAKQQILLLKSQLAELSQYLRPAHPKIIAINKEIDHQEKLLDIFRGQSQEHLQDTRHTLEVEIQNLQASIKEWELKAVDVSKKLADYDAIKSNNVRLQTMYDQLTAAMQTLNVGEQVGQESVTILEPASTPAVVSPQILKHYALAMLLGLVAGIVLLLFLDRLDDRLTTFHELADLFDEPILGQIPKVKGDTKNRSYAVLQPDDDRYALAEAYRNLRSSLVFMDSPQNHPKMIVVTSAIPNDGKSTTAANLAITFARAGARVLLIDADLRRGVMHRHFSTAQIPGLSEVLGEKCEWSKAVLQTSVPNLHLLPCGTPARNSGELFAQRGVKFLEEIGGKYDYYFFDTAPIMAADDVSNLAPHVDGLVMVVRAGFTSGRVAHAALELLYMRKVNILGLVLNGIRPDSSEYGYKYKEYYTVNPAP
jgi:capsular exopolysaccharide synthesis family protein